MEEDIGEDEHFLVNLISDQFLINNFHELILKNYSKSRNTKFGMIISDSNEIIMRNLI